MMPKRLTCYYFKCDDKCRQAKDFINRVYELTKTNQRYNLLMDESKSYAEFVLIESK